MSSFVYVDGDAVNSNLICCICRTPLVDPVSTPACRHTFCRACIAAALARAPQCPVDRSALCEAELVPADPIVRNLVDELVVECVHAPSGCAHTGPRYLADAHDADCAHAPTTCANAGCALVMQRRELAGHVCRDTTRCGACDELIDAGQLDEHAKACDPPRAPCPDCTEPFAAPALRMHRPVCPATVLPCAQAPNGCPWRGPRADGPTHISACAYEAIKGAFAVRDTRAAALEAENAVLRARTGALERALGGLQAEMCAVRRVLGPWCPVADAGAGDPAEFFAGTALDGFYAAGPDGQPAWSGGVAPLELGGSLARTLGGLRASLVAVDASAAAAHADAGALRLALGGLRAHVHSLLADRNARVLAGAGAGVGTKL